jgi:uncharacterized membrane protein YhaH (DUF805 family)
LEKDEKRLGVGSLSLVIFMLGILFVGQIGGNVPLGDKFLSFFGIKAWSNGIMGIHYTIFYSLILFIPSMLISIKHSKDWGGKLGRNLSGSIIVLLAFIMIFVMQ